ncbi:MAG: YjbH domain-containing protein [Rhodospirillales bacterium]|nr:YjbH domain-containing protein [Alphaproteobacteria bacterium]MCB9986241.1 YjbH domain-containing protein [Rhodospirillales bacterium]USO07204.1 MAG: YjbH domain-containing protein [Rhodospirillales bacterium]
MFYMDIPARRRFCLMIVPLLGLLSMVCVTPAWSADSRRCVALRLDEDLAHGVGYGLKKARWQGAEFEDSGMVTIQPRMAGLMGPSVTLLSRDVRLAVGLHQTSPQELWQKARWNMERVGGCAPPPVTSLKSLGRAFYWRVYADMLTGFSRFEPKILERTRTVAEALFTRPYGFIFGGAVAGTLNDNTSALLLSGDTRPPVRRDIALYSAHPEVERLFASWRRTPVTDLHLAVSAGWLEEMYGGTGAEVVWRPFGSSFWAGADGWAVWRRDPARIGNLPFTGSARFTGQARIGYDMPESRFGATLAAGRFLAGDYGAALTMSQGFDNGARLEARIAWSGYQENQGFFRDTRLDPSVRFVWPLGGSRHRAVEATFRQVGRDGGQTLDRPLPLDRMTEGFSAREVARHWPQMLD